MAEPAEKELTAEQVRDILAEIDPERTLFVTTSAAYHNHIDNVADRKHVSYTINIFAKRSCNKVDMHFGGESLGKLLRQAIEWYAAGAVPKWAEGDSGNG